MTNSLNSQVNGHLHPLALSDFLYSCYTHMLYTLHFFHSQSTTLCVSDSQATVLADLYNSSNRSGKRRTKDRKHHLVILPPKRCPKLLQKDLLNQHNSLSIIKSNDDTQ